MSLNLSLKLVEELKAINSGNASEEQSLLSAIVQTLVEIETTQNEVLVPSLMTEGTDDDSPTNQLLASAKVVKRVILDRHTVPSLASLLAKDVNNNVIGVQVNGFRKEVVNGGDQLINESAKALTKDIVRQVVTLKKSLKDFRQMLNELSEKYNESVEQMTELHNE